MIYHRIQKSFNPMMASLHRASVRGFALLILVAGLAMPVFAGAPNNPPAPPMPQAEMDNVLADLATRHGLSEQRAVKARDGRLISYEFNSTKITDTALEAMTKLPFLETLDLSRSSVTDAGLATMTRFTALRQLRLPPHTTDAGISQVVDCSNLELLDLTATKITDAGMKSVGSIAKLRELRLRSTAITDSGLAALASLKNLRILDLQGTAISDKGMELVAGWPLNELNLRQTAVGDASLVHIAQIRAPYGILVLDFGRTTGGISDAGMEHLAKQTAITELYLDQCPITDAGFAKLAGLTNLRVLSLAGTKVTAASFNQISTAYKHIDRVYLTGSGVSYDEALKLQKIFFAPVDKIDLKTASGNISHGKVALVNP